MDITAKILPEYFKDVKAGIKTVEYRHFDNMVLINSETGEKLTRKIKNIEKLMGGRAIEYMQARFPNVPWKKGEPVYMIRLNPR